MENIFVPSKGRSTSKLLKNNKGFTIVVEPQEEHTYKLYFPQHTVLVLPEDNKGITYVRNFIKAITEAVEITSFWMLDDDIGSFYKREGTKLIPQEIGVLKEAENQFKESGLSLGSLEYRQFAWSANKHLIENSFCDSCVWINNETTHGMRYRSYVEGKEDRDFAMQIIKSGLKTGRTTLYAFSAPPNGSNKGGLKEIFYDCGKEEICVQRMIETWGERICVPITKENGRRDVKIIWNEINSSQTSLF